MATIELKNINLKFNDKQILNNFSLKASEGDKILISGGSGTGKSTIVKLLLGFQDIDSGEYLINNKSISEYSYYESRKFFSYVDQQLSLRKINTKRYLEEISKYRGNNLDGKIDKKLCEYFDFDLGLLDENIQNLSGGEKQRLAIIIAIMLKRPFFLLDEVTSALDLKLKMKVVDYFTKCSECVIAISHDNVWLKSEKFRRITL